MDARKKYYINRHHAHIEAQRKHAIEEYAALEAVMENVDPATWPGLTAAQRCALGRFAKPSTDSCKVYQRRSNGPI